MKLKSLKRRFAFACVNHFLSGTRFFSLKARLLRMAGFTIGEHTRIVGPVFCTADLSIGSGCWIGKNLTVHGNGQVTIGDRCDIAPDVTFMTGGHRIADADRRAGTGESYRISVGSGTWIGARATVLGNTAIGTACVIAACACVTKSTPDHHLLGGVPARIIRELDHASEVS